LKTTIVTHVFNEKFLLESWLKHHREIFDEGIVIDFESTDDSLDVIRDLAPHWKVVNSPIKLFSAEPLDRLVESIESELDGIRMTLTATEFLIGNPRELSGNQLIIPSVDLVNMPFDVPFDESLPWHEQRRHGIHYQSTTKYRNNPRGRSIHDFDLDYPLGRHYEGQHGGPMLIYRVAGCLVNEEMIARKLQIQDKIPKSDIEKGYGFQHHDSGRGLTREKVLEQEIYEQSIAVDLGKIFESAINRMKIGAIVSPLRTPAIDYIVTERDSLVTERDSLVTERDSLVTERDSLVTERDSLVTERDSLVTERDSLVTERDSLVNSFSWRLTRPLRSVHRHGKKIRS
jgi:hypothetical protein